MTAASLLAPVVDLARRQRRFLEATWLRRAPQPSWRLPNRVVRDEPAYSLRLFEAQGVEGDGLPALIVPPEVNASTIVDFAPDQSLVGTLLEAGFTRVAVVEWKTATSSTASRTVDDSLQTIFEAIDALGGKVHLLGVCQGGWESACAVALEPSVAASLTLVAAPIDFHAGQSVLKFVARGLPYGFYQALVAAGAGRMKGEFISTGFDNLVPFERHWLIPLSVWNHLDDEAWMERYHQLNDWYRARKDLPGPMYLKVVRDLFKDNLLIEGRFEVLGRRVDLGRITCPLTLVAGSQDHITPPAQLWAAEGVMGSSRVTRVEIDAGHVGTFMGRTALRDHWPQIAAGMRAAQS